MKHNGLKLPEGDLLIHAGDFLGWGSALELVNFTYWLEKQAPKFGTVLMTGGNHDRIVQQQPIESKAILHRIPNLFYLQDSDFCTQEEVLCWGSPWTIEFLNWAFMRRPGFHMDKAWKQIPDNTQILITHSPPKGILDKGVSNPNIGCEMLAYRLGPEGNLRPKLHVFGHSHHSYGQVESAEGILHVNAALVNSQNWLTNPPVVLDL